MTIPFIKMHGLGNDFVIFDARKKPLALNAAKVKRIADRRLGIGCDQVIVLENVPSPQSPVSRKESKNAMLATGDRRQATIFMKIYNADGSEVASCGNATRCVAWLLMEESGKKDIAIETKAGLLTCKSAGKFEITADMGAPVFDWKKIPLSKHCDIIELPIVAGKYRHPAAVSMGNPHMVFATLDVHKVPLPVLGPKLEKHPLFPKRVNVSFAEIVGAAKIKLRVWERGAGETLACGTAACASLVALHNKGLIGRKAEVMLPGGSLMIEWDVKTNHVLMTGAVAKVFEGAVEL